MEECFDEVARAHVVKQVSEQCTAEGEIAEIRNVRATMCMSPRAFDTLTAFGLK